MVGRGKLSLALVGVLGLVAGAMAGEGAPVGMEDAGGQALVLEKLAVRLAAHGPLALTELEMVFRNPLDRQIEGRFTCTLPPEASLSRFAKEVDGRLMEGEVVERLKATQVYTEILHSMRDPALLESDQGNQFKARIFPIGPKATTRLLIGYSTAVPAGPDGRRTLSIPLKGLGQVGAFSLSGVCRPLPGETVVLEGWLSSYSQTRSGDEVLFADARARADFLPPDDVRLSFQAVEGAPSAQALRAGANQMLSFRTPAAAGRAGPLEPDEWILAVDTSASKASGWPLELQVFEKLLPALDAVRGKAPARLLGFDLDPRLLAEVPAGTASAAPFEKALAARRALGATDLAAALKMLGEAVRRDGSSKLAVLVTDGIASLGPREGAALAAALGAWPASATLHVLVLGSTYDQGVCQALAEAGRGRVVQLPLVEGFGEKIAGVLADLRRPPGASFSLADQAAAWIEPAAFRDVSPGAELLAFAALRPGVPSRPRLTAADGTVTDLKIEPLEVPGYAALLARETARAELRLLERQEGVAPDPEARAKLRARRLEVSVGKRVACPLTAMLVLESEADYVRYGIDRRALADILEVTAKGIGTVDRPAAPPPPPPRLGLEKLKEEAKLQREATTNKSPADPGSFDGRRGGQSGGEGRGARQLSWELMTSSASLGDESAAPPAESPALATEDSEESFGSEDGDSEPRGGAPDVALSPSVSAPYPASPVNAPRFAPPPPRPSETRPDSGGSGGSSGHEQDYVPSQLGSEPAPARKAIRPTWTDQAKTVATAAELARQEKEVAASPKDRALRNRLCWDLLRAGAFEKLEAQAWAWQPFDPANPMLYEYLAESYRGRDLDDAAKRALTSIAEVSPTDSGLLNRAGYLALRAEDPKVAEQLFRVAIERRPDHANNYRGLALALWTQGRFEDAAKVLADALGQTFSPRYGDLPRVLREELGLILAAWAKAEPAAAAKATALGKANAAALRDDDALRFTLHWETDANDVDLHIVDPAGDECFYSNKVVASGLNLYEDLTQGLGPEVAVVPQGRKLPGTYHVGVKYFAAGPMGVSRGVVVIHRPSPDGAPRAAIHTFTLLPDIGGQDMRHLAVVE